MNYLSIIIVFLSLASCAESDKSNQDKTKKEQTAGPVDAALDLSDDASLLAYLRKSNPELQDDDVCINRISDFQGLILVGYFAHDRGCEGGLVFYKDQEMTFNGLSERVLKDNGWSDRTKKAKLAIDYTIDVLKAWESVLTEEPDNFSQDSTGYAFAAPSAILEDGEVNVTCWIKEPAGMQPVDEYYHFSVTFGEDGSVLKSETSNRFAIEM